MPDRFPIDYPKTEDWFEAWRQYNYYYGHSELPPEPTVNDQHHKQNFSDAYTEHNYYIDYDQHGGV
ncbi:MAG: hypothetical protein FH749_14170 [Firmicutes bacterium]|nr:hypothetical protein [Bacillota bacterium]